LKIPNEIKVGLLAIAAIVLLFFGMRFLSGKSALATQQIYYATYANIDGLYESNPVYINGYKVGVVNKLFLREDGQITIAMLLDKDLKVPFGTTAEIFNKDLLGAKAVQLIYPLQLANSYHESKDTLSSDVALGIMQLVESKIDPSIERLEILLTSIDTTVGQINGLLADDDGALKDGIATIGPTLKNLNATSVKLNNIISSASGSIDGTLGNLNSVSQNLASNNQRINTILSNTEDFSAQLKNTQIEETVAEAQKTLASLNTVLNNVNEGEGSVSLLMNDPALYQNLVNSINSINALLGGLQDNPEVVIRHKFFGGKKENKK